MSLALVLLSLVALSVVGQDYASSAPGSWKREAELRARHRLAAMEREASTSEMRAHHMQEMTRQANREYRKATKLVSARESSSALASLTSDVGRIKKQEQQLLRRALELEKRASSVAGSFGTTDKVDELGEARDGAETHNIRAAQMRGQAARWRMKAERWEAGADRVEAALKESSKAREEKGLEAINEDTLRVEQKTNQIVDKLKSHETVRRAGLLSAERNKNAAHQMKLSKQLRSLKQRLEAEESINEQEWEAVRRLLPSVHSMERDSVGLRAQLERILTEEGQVLAGDRSKIVLDHWASTPPRQTASEENPLENQLASTQDDTSQIKQMHAHQKQAKLLLQKAEQQATGAEQDAIELLTWAKEEMPGTTESSSITLGESEGSPRTALLARAKAKRELRLMQSQQRAIVKQVRQHNELKTKLVVKDTKIADSLKSAQLMKQIAATKDAIKRAQGTVTKQKAFVEKRIQNRLKEFHKHAMQTVVDVTEAITLD